MADIRHSTFAADSHYKGHVHAQWFFTPRSSLSCHTAHKAMYWFNILLEAQEAKLSSLALLNQRLVERKDYMGFHELDGTLIAFLRI